MRFAILDDNEIELALIQKSVSSISPECHPFTSGEALLKSLRRESYDFLILDWELPGVSGLEIVKWVRQNTKDQIPILMVTNRQDEKDVIAGLSAGADDFMVKPIRAGELVARVKALIRRIRPSPGVQKMTWGRYVFTPKHNHLEFNGELLTLKNKEYELALFLFQNIGRLISRQHIQDKIWGTKSSEVNSRSLDTHISAIRNKLALRPENGFHLVSVYGFGYRLENVLADESDKI